MDDTDDPTELDDPPCLFCWALGWAGGPCPGHRLAVRRQVCDDVG